jgi:hypothetical protein
VTIEFIPATKDSCKARIALAGPSGSGKTYTGLSIGHWLARDEGTRLAVIDTERGSASKYLGLNGWQWDRFHPQSFAPESLIEALGVAAGSGHGVVLLDSWSHYWMGVDGMLEQVDRRTAASGSKSSYSSGWKDMAPVERRMVDAIVSYPGHVIATLRVKTEYVLETDPSSGKKKPVKVGMKPQQRDGLEYEFDLVGDLDNENTMTVSKTRIPMLHGAVLSRPGEELAVTIRDWLAEGQDVPGPLAYRSQALDPDVTFDGLRVLRDTVLAAGLLNAPVTDEDGNPTVLGDLIIARAKGMQPARGVA